MADFEDPSEAKERKPTLEDVTEAVSKTMDLVLKLEKRIELLEVEVLGHAGLPSTPSLSAPGDPSSLPSKEDLARSALALLDWIWRVLALHSKNAELSEKETAILDQIRSHNAKWNRRIKE